MKKTNEQKGITLVALIITIIVLLILAVVAISAVSGDGILGYAKKSTEDYKLAQAKETAQLILDEWKIVKHTPGSNLLTFLQSKLGEENVKQNGDAYIVTIDGYEIIISNEQIMSKEEFENMPVTGEVIGTNTVKVGDLVYLITDEEKKTAEVHGYRDVENMDYSIFGNIIMNNPTITATELVIASKVEINGEIYTVTSMGYNMFGMDAASIPIQRLTIPGTITNIGSLPSASESTPNTILTDFIILEGKENINISYAFNYYTSLKNVTIPSNVTSIENSFNNCTNLENVTIQESTSHTKSFIGSKWMSSFKDENGLVIINNVLIDGTQATGSVTIPSNVTRIEDYAFKDCTQLTEVVIPDTVTYIGKEAFSNTGLTSVIYPKAASIDDTGYVMSTSSSIFSNCASLSNVIIPEDITGIANYAFSGCTSLTSITIPDSVTIIGNSAFSGSKLSNVTIPSNMLEISTPAFAGCNYLENIDFINGVKYIGYGAFENCSSLKNITIPNSVEEIHERAFNECSSLQSVTYHSGIKLINRDAFYNTPYYTTLYNNTESNEAVIDQNIYFTTKPIGISLDDVVIPEGVTLVAEGAFWGYPLCFGSITIPSSVQYVPKEFMDSSWTGSGGFSEVRVYWENNIKPEGWDDEWNVDGDSSVTVTNLWTPAGE